MQEMHAELEAAEEKLKLLQSDNAKLEHTVEIMRPLAEQVPVLEEQLSACQLARTELQIEVSRAHGKLEGMQALMVQQQEKHQAEVLPGQSAAIAQEPGGTRFTAWMRMHWAQCIVLCRWRYFRRQGKVWTRVWRRNRKILLQ